MTQPWERQKGESHQAFEAFATYRDMRGKRSTAAVAQSLGKSKTLMDRWSSRWSWVDRTAAYDNQLDKEFRDEVARLRIEVARKHASVAAMMLQKATQRLVQVDPATLTPNELERWMRTATEIERSALHLDDLEENAVKQAAGAVTELVRSLRTG